MEEWSLSILFTSLTQMLLTVWDVLTGSLEATLQLLFTLTRTQRLIHTEKCNLKKIIQQHYKRLNTVQHSVFLQVKKETNSKALYLDSTTPISFKSFGRCISCSNQPFIRRTCYTPKNKEVILKSVEKYSLKKPNMKQRGKKIEKTHYALFVVAVIRTQPRFSLALNLAGGLGNTVTVKCTRGPHGSWLWQVTEERPG